MAPHPRPTFRVQAEEAFGGFAGIVGYLLFQVASKTEVRTEGDRVLVTVCAIGTGLCIVVLTLLVARAAIRRLRASRDADAAAADALPDGHGRTDDAGRPDADVGLSGAGPGRADPESRRPTPRP